MSDVDKNTIIEAVRRGLVVWPGHDETPVPCDDDYTGYDESGHDGPKGHVRADDLRDAMRHLIAGDPDWDPRGLRLRDATITGTLDLNWFTLPFPIAFEGCEFDEWIWADHLTLPQLVFDTCRFASFGGTGIRVQGRLLFFGCTGVEQIFLPDAHVGVFELRPESFEDPSGLRFVLSGASIDELTIDYFATLHGGVELFTELDQIIPGDAFDDVEIGRLSTPGRPLGRAPIWRWLRGGEVITPGRYLAAWLAADTSVSVRPPHLGARMTKWCGRWISQPSVGRRYVPQAWQRVAGALDASGMGEEARTLRIEAERFRVRTESGRLRQLGSALFFDLPIRYGYRNSRVGWILLTLFTLAAFIVQTHPSAFVAASDLPGDDGYPGLWPLAYALDVVVSPVNTGQSDAWWTGASPGVATALIAIKVASWVLGGIFIAGVSSKISRS